jgi:hypothetical protein
MKNNRVDCNWPCATSVAFPPNGNAAEKVRDIGDDVPPGNNSALNGLLNVKYGSAWKS